MPLDDAFRDCQNVRIVLTRRVLILSFMLVPPATLNAHLVSSRARTTLARVVSSFHAMKQNGAKQIQFSDMDWESQRLMTCRYRKSVKHAAQRSAAPTTRLDDSRMYIKRGYTELQKDGVLFASDVAARPLI